MSKYLWLAVEADEYELPLAVEDDPKVLAERFGLSWYAVRTSADKGYDGTATGRKFVKVLKDE